MLASLLGLSVLVSAVALSYARWEYRKRGKQTAAGLALLCAMLFIPNLVLEYATTYQVPSTVVDYVGVVIGVAGLVICLASMVAFRSTSKILCLETGQLTTAGPYRWSRNPQYVGWFMFVLGFALNDWSLWCLAALFMVAISLHLLVLVEEEHLHRVFGEQYREFQLQVPRYAAWGRRR
ncbi:MAG: isoprenylcysteine carboxylmethyltransferase family protein [Gammaproteobacteria bacterium]|nr:isoprenylcysteine carboxylmethyltransferase family protein [Gammaproteobacteria bacterium]